MIRHPWRMLANLVFAVLLGVFMGYTVKANISNTGNLED
jgi:F0F1-type ATP synthase assembly protein I